MFAFSPTISRFVRSIQHMLTAMSTGSSTASAVTETQPTKLSQQLIDECRAMTAYALASGKLESVSAEIIQELDQITDGAANVSDLSAKQLAKLIKKHKTLSELVAPATPGALDMLDAFGNKGRAQVFRQLPIVRHLVFTAFFCLITFITLTIFKEQIIVYAQSNREVSDGVESALFSSLYYVSAAGLGAAFNALRRVNQYIEERRFDQAYVASYWIRFLLGLMAGPVLTILRPLDIGSVTLSSALIALWGGYSSDVLFAAMARISNSLERFVSGHSGTTTR